MRVALRNLAGVKIRIRVGLGLKSSLEFGSSLGQEFEICAAQLANCATPEIARNTAIRWCERFDDLAVSKQHTSVIDRQTDRQTDRLP